MSALPGAPPGPDAAIRTASREKGALFSRSRLLHLFSPRSAFATLLRPALDDLITTFFPSECRLCGDPLHNASFASVCFGCLARLQPHTGATCHRCGESLGMESARFTQGFAPAEGLICAPCRSVPPAFERAVAFGSYQDELRGLIQLFKFEGQRSLAAELGAHLAQAILSLRDEAGPALMVIAVPLWSTRRHTRGFNQSDLLARNAMRELRRLAPGWCLELRVDALLRTRATESQFALTPAGRRRNLKGAFAVPNPSAIAGAEVLLVDDIYTTGATARECSTVLRRAGAAKVWVATVARAQKPQVALWDAATPRQPPIGFG